MAVADRVPAPPDLAADDRVTELRGDIAALAGGALADPDVVFHLAAAVSAECEADFDLGIRANLHATEALLAGVRAAGTNPVVVFASSLAVFGSSPEHPLPAVVDDQTMLNPQSSYGIQKVIGEQLLADYTRRGFLRGRAVRLMTVSVRPGRPNAAASGFLSGIIREPLAGHRATCPVGPQTEVALSSPGSAIAGLLCAATSAEEAWADRTAMNLPALTVTVGEMVAALERAGGPGRERTDRLGARPRDRRDRDGLAGSLPHQPGGGAWPAPRPGLRLHHRRLPGAGPALTGYPGQDAEGVVAGGPARAHR